MTTPAHIETSCANCSHPVDTHTVDLINSLTDGSACTICLSCPAYVPNVEPGYESVRVMRLEPGDVIVVKLAIELDEREAARIKNSLERTFLGHRAVVLDPGMEISVARPGEVNRAHCTVSGTETCAADGSDDTCWCADGEAT